VQPRARQLRTNPKGGDFNSLSPLPPNGHPQVNASRSRNFRAPDRDLFACLVAPVPRDGEGPARGVGGLLTCYLAVAQPPRLRRWREHSRRQGRGPSATLGRQAVRCYFGSTGLPLPVRVVR
jgi:hypothetical protein